MRLSPRDDEEAPASALLGESAGAPADDGAPSGPAAGEEDAFLAEQRGSNGGEAPGTDGPGAAPGGQAELPPLEDLVARIPAPTRQLVDELFRAKFYTVKRVPESALK